MSVSYAVQNGLSVVRRVSADGVVSIIPMNEGNRDYAAYLEWLAEGNTPEPWPPAEV